jgi:hypothetical protein
VTYRLDEVRRPGEVSSMSSSSSDHIQTEEDQKAEGQQHVEQLIE